MCCPCVYLHLFQLFICSVFNENKTINASCDEYDNGEKLIFHYAGKRSFHCKFTMGAMHEQMAMAPLHILFHISQAKQLNRLQTLANRPNGNSRIACHSGNKSKRCTTLNMYFRWLNERQAVSVWKKIYR